MNGTESFYSAAAGKAAADSPGASGGKCSVVQTRTDLGLANVFFGVLDLQLQIQSSLLGGR